MDEYNTTPWVSGGTVRRKGKGLVLEWGVGTLSTGAYKLRTLSYITIVLSLFLFSVVSFTWMGVYCVALLTQLSFEPPPQSPHPTPSLLTYSVPVPHNESATCLFKERFLGVELACPIGSSIIKIIPMVMCSLSGFVIQVIKRRSACLFRPKIF